MTLDIVSLAPRSPVEDLLADLLDREWDVQSARMAPLVITAPVRDSLELVFASSPQGIFGIAPELQQAAASPADLLDRLRDRLPAHLAPWTLRALRGVGSLRAARPLPPALPAAPQQAEPPALPPAPASPPALAAPPEPRAEPSRAPRAIALAGACGAALGAPVGVLGATLDAPGIGIAAVLGALAATLGGLVATAFRDRRALR